MKTCQNCGNVFDDNFKFCTRCGTQYIEQPAPQPQQPAQQTPPAQYNQYSNPYSQPYRQPTYTAPADPPMTLGQWVGTILLTQCLGIISIILLFVWGFSNDVPLSKKNYCRAMLIFEAIALGVVILIMIFMFSIVATGAGLGMSGAFAD